MWNVPSACPCHRNWKVKKSMGARAWGRHKRSSKKRKNILLNRKNKHGDARQKEQAVRPSGTLMSSLTPKQTDCTVTFLLLWQNIGKKILQIPDHYWEKSGQELPNKLTSLILTSIWISGTSHFQLKAG